MTPRTRTQPRSTPLRSPHQAVGLFLGAAVLAVLIVAPSLAPATFVPRITVENPTPFDVNVDVSAGSGGGRIQVGTVDRETEGTLEEVADPGPTWVFRFSYGGVDGADVTVSRSALRADGWLVTVPAEVNERLTAAGFAASAR